MKDLPIFIIGSPRSGTTFLGNLLSQHRTLAYLEEPRTIWRYGNESRSDLLRPEDASPKVCRYIHNAFAQRVAESGKPRLLEKTPSNALRLGFMSAVYPDAYFVHVLRNGYDAALSIRSLTVRHSVGVPRGRLMQRLKEISPRQYPYYAKEMASRVLPKALRSKSMVPMWGPRLPGMAGMAAELDPLELACLQWRACVESACNVGRTMPSDRYLEIRLEDFNPDVLKQVMAFCQLDDDPDVERAMAEQFRPEDPAGRRSKASPEELQRIQPWIEPTMQWLGYPSGIPQTGNDAAS